MKESGPKRVLPNNSVIDPPYDPNIYSVPSSNPTQLKFVEEAWSYMPYTWRLRPRFSMQVPRIRSITAEFFDWYARVPHPRTNKNITRDTEKELNRAFRLERRVWGVEYEPKEVFPMDNRSDGYMVEVRWWRRANARTDTSISIF